MRKLSDNEIRFIKETKVTPQVIVGDEWNKTPYKNLNEATDKASKDYKVELDEMMKKCEACDGISLEYAATYLFYTFFSMEELQNLSGEDALAWLQDFKYFFGYRKWTIWDAEIAVDEALEVYHSTREFFEAEDQEIWNKEVD